MASLAAKISSADGAFDKEFATLSIQEKVKKIVEELQKVNFLKIITRKKLLNLFSIIF